MNDFTHLSLFSGIGGLDLAAEWAGFQTVGQCEWADYPTKVLEKHWSDVPRWRDIRTLTGESFYERTGLRTVDVISGGFPCQPFSVAGKQRGKEDDRYLWPEMVRVIKELRPTWIIGENVAGIVKMALPDILSELEGCGYRTRAFLVPACAVGARHRRYRVAIVGYTEHNGLYAPEIAGSTEKTGGRQQEREEAPCKPARTSGSGSGCNVADAKSQHKRGLPIRESAENAGSIRGGEDVADTKGERERGLPVQPWEPRQKDIDIKRSGKRISYANGTGCEEQHASAEPDQQEFHCGGYFEGRICNPTGGGTSKREWPAQSGLGGVVNGISCGMDRDYIINHYWDTEPDIPRVAAGVPDRVGRLKALGNAVVPQQFYPFFSAIVELMEKAD